MEFGIIALRGHRVVPARTSATANLALLAANVAIRVVYRCESDESQQSIVLEGEREREGGCRSFA